MAQNSGDTRPFRVRAGCKKEEHQGKQEKSLRDMQKEDFHKLGRKLLSLRSVPEHTRIPLRRCFRGYTG